MTSRPEVLYLTSGNGRVKYDYNTGLISLTLYGSLDQVTGTREWNWDDSPAALRLAIIREDRKRSEIQKGIKND